MATTTKKKTKTVIRSSITGKFIKPSTAKRHPKTSIKQKVPTSTLTTK